MNFTVLSVLLAAVAALALCWPLLRPGSLHRGLGMLLVLGIPAASLLLYQGVGTPEGQAIQGTPAFTESQEPTDFEQLVEQLGQRLEENPDDLDGWLLLSRSYKTLQQFDQARTALERAAEIAPDDPVVAVELAEAMIFTARDGRLEPAVRELLEGAVEREPRLQKGLWLMGIVESRAGNDTAALAWWERLLPLLEPGSDVSASVQAQIEAARGRLGMPPAASQPASATATGWSGIEATVQLPDGMDEAPPGAVLFVIARDPAAPTPPLGAQRIEAPSFPVTVRLTDADSMLPQRPISSASPIELVARLSLSGQPMAGPDDPESDGLAVDAGDAMPVTLKLRTASP